MPRKQRDYRAEYQRRKSLAQSRGYSGPYQQSKARKILKLPRDFAPIQRKDLPKSTLDRLLRTDIHKVGEQSLSWANEHSHMKETKYPSHGSDEQKRRFKEAFVDKPPKGRRGGKIKQDRIYAYLDDYFPRDDGQSWAQYYESE
jgi:hypothetical protein